LEKFVEKCVSVAGAVEEGLGEDGSDGRGRRRDEQGVKGEDGGWKRADAEACWGKGKIGEIQVGGGGVSEVWRGIDAGGGGENGCA
jgi:hypothetical protein